MHNDSIEMCWTCFHAEGSAVLKRLQLDPGLAALLSSSPPAMSNGGCHVQRQGLIKDLNLVEDKLPEYLRAIEEGYNNTNPYHNRHVPEIAVQSIKASLQTHACRLVMSGQGATRAQQTGMLNPPGTPDIQTNMD